MSYTKGPWKVEHHRGNIEIWNQNRKVAVINEAHEIQDGPQDLANADLIAASADMIELLEGFVAKAKRGEFISDKTAFVMSAVRVIKKARGEK